VSGLELLKSGVAMSMRDVSTLVHKEIISMCKQGIGGE
jgi:hypothetical protein